MREVLLGQTALSTQEKTLISKNEQSNLYVTRGLKSLIQRCAILRKDSRYHQKEGNH